MTTTSVTKEEIFAAIVGKTNVAEAIDIIKNIGRMPHPTKPITPKLNSVKPSLEEVKQYYIDLEAYPDKKIAYELDLIEYNKENGTIHDCLVELIKEESGFNTIPEQYRDKVYSYAYEAGHSDGYYSVYIKLEGLVEIFK